MGLLCPQFKFKSSKKVLRSSTLLALPSNYILIIAEKPDAARKIAIAVAERGRQQDRGDYILCEGKKNYVITSAAGHMYTLTPSASNRDIYPVLDLHWVPLSSVEPSRKDVHRKLESIRHLAENASEIIIACDYDIEGDTIGFNILKHACSRTQASRVKFSTLTSEELRKSFSKPSFQTLWPLAEAGLTRHYLDYVWGVNLSRVLTNAMMEVKGGYANLSIGRVQGPTLNYIFEREIAIRSFVPTPYWHITATGKSGSQTFLMEYAIRRIMTSTVAKRIKQETEGRDAKVTEATVHPFSIPPPPPFNLGDLQREAYRLFGLSPSQTLSIAEKLYLGAAISYPRTSSQQIPSSVNCLAILAALSKSSNYAKYICTLPKASSTPVQGQKTDSAHPAIYPTGELPLNIKGREWLLFDLIVRRFLAAFGKRALKERISINAMCQGHKFIASATRVLSKGWMEVYRVPKEAEDCPLPHLREGDIINLCHVIPQENFENPPFRYNQSSLLDQMEHDNIGTKATRAEIISTLIDRGYVTNGSMQLTDLGFAIIESTARHSPAIISLEMTHIIENELNDIELQITSPKAVEIDGVERLLSCLELFDQSRESIGETMYAAHVATNKKKDELGACPICHKGHLKIIRSRKTGKRFVGCTNYSNGCKASAPLPQRGLIRPTRYQCKTCGWPIMLVFFSFKRKPWRLCINPSCPDKVTKVNREAVTKS